MTLFTAGALGSPSPGHAQPRASRPPAVVPGGPLAAADDRFFDAGDVTIRYRDVGAGDAVILVHGWARTLADWNAVAGALAPTHRVIAMDVRGFGRSDKSGDPAQFGSRMADDVVRLLDHLGIARAHLAGQSMGALIVADVAARYSNRVASVTLISGPFASAPWESEVIADLRAGRGLARMLQPLADAGMNPDTVAGIAALLLAQNDVPSLIASLSSLAALRSELRPTPSVASLLLCGTADPLLAASRQLAARWPHARLIEVEGATHALLGRPEVGSAMLEFLRRLPR
jgi:pimeloyl-ACP methyl ester carboxylesterase